jgi:hypothetical protein
MKWMKWIVSSMAGLFGISFCMLAALFLAIGGGTYYFINVYTLEGMELTTAMVTGLRQGSSGGRPTYCLEVEFTTASGETVQADPDECSFPARYKTGDSLEVYYDPANPQRTSVKGGVAQTVGTTFLVMFGIVGGVFALIGAVGIVGGLLALRIKAR